MVGVVGVVFVGGGVGFGVEVRFRHQGVDVIEGYRGYRG